MDVTSDAGRQFTGRHMLLLVIAFFGIILIVNLALAYFALGSWPGLLVKNDFEASQTYNEKIRQSRIQEQLGWKSRLVINNGMAILSIADKTATPLRGLGITAAAERPTNEAEDRMIEFTGAPDGSYRGEANLAAGAWIISILAEDVAAKRTYRRQFRIFVAKE